MKLFTLLVFTSLLSFVGYAEAFETDIQKQYVKTELIPEFNSVVPGETLHFAVKQTHTEGWHTYWKNPGDSGETISIAWQMPKEFEAGIIQYPTPEQQPMGPLMNFGFSGTTTLLTSISIPPEIQDSNIPIKAKLSWLVCKDICIPEVQEFSFNLPVQPEAGIAQEPDLFASARAAIPLALPWQGQLEEQNESVILSFVLDENAKSLLKDAKDFFFFPEEWGIILNPEPQNIRLENDKLVIGLKRDTRPLNEIQTLTGILSFKDNTGQHKGISLSLPVGATQVINQTANPQVDYSTTSFMQAIVLALLGGIILNLMPCVFPVLSLKALSLVKMSEKEQSHANIHGLLYTLGIMVCFGGIAGLMIILQMAGQQIGWGFQLQNPIVVLLLAYLLFVISLNLAGFFEIKGGMLSNIGHRLASHHGYKGSFFTGMLATIVATPCTAPFMATAMGYALTQPPLISLLVFLTLGLGLALPYLLLCFIPKLRQALPKPGAWMETFRQFLSFPMFASVAWLVWVYSQQVEGGYGTLLGLLGLVFIAFSIWIWGHEPKQQPWKTALHGLSISSIILALLIAFFSHTGADTVSQTDAINTRKSHHHIFTTDLYNQMIAGNDPIFVDMTAAWCITCKYNEKTALLTQTTQKLFKERDIQLLIGDWTNQNPEITEYLSDYGRNGVPLYVYYGPRDSVSGQRPEPKILPQFLTNGIIAEVIKGEE